MITTTISTTGHHRLEQLYEVSKLFNAFASVDETVGKALQVVAVTCPLTSAILIQSTIGCHTEITVWQCEDSGPARLLAARAHAEAVYADLVGARSVDTLDLRQRMGSATLPAPRNPRVPREHTRRFIVIPLVVGRGMVFGALQLEAASGLDRSDVEFVNTLANQLAIALDRDRLRRHDVVRRREAQLSQARYESIVDRLDSAFVWEADLETHRMSYVSAQFEQMLGFSRRQCLDERDWWRSHVHPDDRRLLEQTFARALGERGEQRCDLRVLTSSKAILWLHTSVHLADVPGEAPRFQGLSHDITAARAEQDDERFLLDACMTLSASLESAEVANAIARLGVLHLGDICLVDVVSEAGQPRCVAWAHRDPAAQGELDRVLGGRQHPPLLSTPVIDVIASGGSRLLPVGSGDWLSSAELAVVQHQGVRSALIVPFELGERRLGALTVGRFEDRQPDDREVALAERFARRGALAIEHARLYEAARRAVELPGQALAI